ncbi:MAG: patatin-like phospholipase family protein [Leeuwenhoekiella sp.]
MSKKNQLFLLCFFCLVSLAGAQVVDSIPKNLKVGLVLSGGGAKGLAHIGVLKEIDAAGIQLDYIGGTSMGAIVGGMYAAGYSARQLDSLFKIIDFEELIQDEIPRQDKTFYERNLKERYALTLPFRNFKPTLPSALSKGQNMYNLFTQLLHPVGQIDDFSQLPVPFFCVATDVEKGKAIVFDSGYLPLAMAASGALPSLFSPIVIDGKLILDGGVVDNYPVEELRSRGINYVIGVDVQDGLRDREALTSAPEILVQINNYRTIEAMKSKKELTDIYIRPDIEGFSVVDFDRGQQIIDSGRVAASKFREALVDLAARQTGTKRQHTLTAEFPEKLDIASVTIKGNAYYTRSYILGKLKMQAPLTASFQSITHGLNALIATDNFNRVNHRLIEKESGYELEIEVDEKDITTFLRASLHYDDLYKSAALANVTKKRVLFRNDLVSFDLILGDNSRYELNYLSDNGFYLGFGMKSYYNRFEKRVDARFIEQISNVPLPALNNIGVEYQDFTNQLFIQTLFERIFTLRLGLEQKLIEIETQTIRQAESEDQRFYFEDSNYWSLFGELQFDSLDDKYFPISGAAFNGDFHLYLYASDFNPGFDQFSIGRANFTYAQSIFDNLAINIGVEGGFKIGGKQVNSLDFYLGGWGNNFKNNIVPFFGYDFFGAAGDGLVKSNLTLDFHGFKNSHILFGGNFANVENDLFISGNWLSAPDYTGYFLGYGLETLLGPLQARYSYSPERKAGQWYFSLGFWF